MSEPKPDESGIRIQDRDLAILRGLFESRIMTAAHIAVLHFNGSGDAAKLRLRKLKDEGLIGERTRKVNEPAILFLTAKAFDVLQKEGKLADYPQIPRSALMKRTSVSDLKLRHELEILDVKSALYAGISKTTNLSLEEFSTWPLLYEFEVPIQKFGSGKKKNQPDGYIRIKEIESATTEWEHVFFFELDRSTETQDILVTKARYYLDYYRSGGFAEWRGGSRSAPDAFSFYVLMVVQNSKRRNNTTEELLAGYPPINTMVWLTTLAEIKANPLGPIWVCPDDYREATQDTPFALSHIGRRVGHRKEGARDNFVEQTIRKTSLIMLSPR